jgi:predicted phosphoribosyltransferase
VWRLAATLGVVIAGGASMLVARRGIVGVQGPTELQIAAPTESSTTMAIAPQVTETLAVAVPAASSHSVSVSYGDLGDYSEAELESMLDRLDKWDGATNTEPLPGVPILPNAGGGTP